MRLSWICQEKNAPNGLIINKNIAKYHMQFSNRKLLRKNQVWSEKTEETMPKIKYRFSLSQEERDELKAIVAKGKHNSQPFPL